MTPPDPRPATEPFPTSPDGTAEPPVEAVPEPEVPLLTEPADGVPEVVSTPEALEATIAALVAGTGPLAVDAERAHGFRYSQRAYLIQLRRAGAGTHLVDPIAFGTPADLSALGDALADAEWVVHAASQDLPCLFEVGLVPRTLFDTELAARLLGYPRVALGTMIEEFFGVRLLKEHSASDWSTRPLPPEWLTYAALDVELLVELRDKLADELVRTGKDAWARQEFAALVAGAGTAPEKRTDPWRRTSGIHKVRTRRGLGYVAELWYARDDIAQRLDRAPGKILPDAAISEIAAAPTPGRASMRQIPAFSRRQAKRYESTWVEALETVGSRGETGLPPLHIPNDGPPQPRLWAARDPEAAARLTAVREALSTKAAELDLPVENLLTPDHVRRLAWRPPQPVTEESVDAALAASGARAWQRELTVPLITPLLLPPEPAAG
ncbi:ribonuclease D [Microlunatus capsulatus]|uniref:Ribonuclease D n=1 Tax=Microlunatus capsulatus TaxID=99117 RepID=A0ABS4ZD95_9ACTN|nr:HRDC domain-containing protein [Microlunatus capsulatus]MBP2419002.1 ribonuclease D [Microlunatus capsulatus]